MKATLCLVELNGVQSGAEPLRRRWFNSADLDLIVWLGESAQALEGFQLCYGKPRAEHMFSWSRSEGYRHQHVESGDNSGMGHKRSPIMVSNSRPPELLRLQALLESATGIPVDILQQVHQRIKGYDETGHG